MRRRGLSRDRGRRPLPALWPPVLGALAIAAFLLHGQVQSLAQIAASVTDHEEQVSGAAYRVKTVSLEDGTRALARWNPCQKAITFKVNLDGAPASERRPLLAEVTSGFGKLAVADGMTYRYTGTTRFVPQQDNVAKAPAEIVVAAIGRSGSDLNMAESALGFGGVVWATWSGARGDGAAVVRGYVIIHPADILALPYGFGAKESQGNVILHELGHATGLEHAGTSSDLMYPTIGARSPAGYSAGDLAGLQRVGVSAGCLKIPASVGVRDLS